MLLLVGYPETPYINSSTPYIRENTPYIALRTPCIWIPKISSATGSFSATTSWLSKQVFEFRWKLV